MSRVEWKLFLIVWIGLSANVCQFGPRNNPMVRNILFLTMSLVDHGKVNIDDQVDPYAKRMTPAEARALPTGDVRLLPFTDVSYHDGHYYSGMPPGLSWAAAIPYLVSKPILRAIPQAREGYGNFDASEITRLLLAVATVFLFVAPLTALAAVLLLRLLNLMGVSKKGGLWCVVAFVAGSLVVQYGSLVSHQLTGAMLGFVACYLLFSEAIIPSLRRVRVVARFVLAGLLAGLAVTVEYSQALVVFVLLTYGYVRLGPKRLGLFAIGITAMGALHAWYGYEAFGSILGMPYGFRFVSNIHPHGFFHVRYPLPIALWGLTFSLYKGFFVYMPWAIISILGAMVAIPRNSMFRAEAWCVLAVFGVMLLYNSSIYPFWPGYGYGPRYMISAVPFLALGLAFVPGWASTPLVKGAVALSTLLNALTVAAGSPHSPLVWRSTHLWLAEIIWREGPQTHVMRMFEANIHPLSRGENLVLFTLWVVGLVLLCWVVVLIVDFAYRKGNVKERKRCVKGSG